uniref:Hepcidin n=1 Tax=Xiphophorus maculatus TaxID=8083 RepID=A0A3B5PVJ9_XIPMA
MKTFAVAATVSLLLPSLCVHENSAVPVDEARTLLQSPFFHWSAQVDENKMKENEYPGPARCRFCCGCCLADVCGLCCD